MIIKSSDPGFMLRVSCISWSRLGLISRNEGGLLLTSPWIEWKGFEGLVVVFD